MLIQFYRNIFLLFLFLIYPNFLFSKASNSSNATEKSAFLKTDFSNNVKYYFEGNELLKLKDFLGTNKANDDKDLQEVLAAINSAKKKADLYDTMNQESEFFFKMAIKIAKKKKRIDLEVYSNINYAFYLYHFRKYKNSFPYFMFCLKNLENMETKDVIEPYDTLTKLSYFLITANENDLAITFIKRAEEIPGLGSSELASLKDCIGTAYLNKKQLDLSKDNYKLALNLAQKGQDHLREAKVLGNIAEIDFQQGNYKQAVDYLNKDIAISKKIANDQNSMFALIKLCKVYLKMDQVALAKTTIMEAEKFANSKTYFKSSLYEINEFLLEIAKKEKNASAELETRRKLEDLKESLKNFDGKDVVVAVNWSSEKMRLEYNIKSEKENLAREAFLRNCAIILCVVLILAIFGIIYLNNIRRKARQKLYDKNLMHLTLDKVRSENKLNATTLTISSYRNYLLEKNNQIKELESEVKKLEQLPEGKKQEYAGKLDDLLQAHLLSHENWTQFKMAFRNEKPKHTMYLEENFPDLTDANLRVIYLTILELNNSEIARILGVTLSAVKKTKQRLRQKYDGKYDELFEMTS